MNYHRKMLIVLLFFVFVLTPHPVFATTLPMLKSAAKTIKTTTNTDFVLKVGNFSYTRQQYNYYLRNISNTLPSNSLIRRISRLQGVDKDKIPTPRDRGRLLLAITASIAHNNPEFNNYLSKDQKWLKQLVQLTTKPYRQNNSKELLDGFKKIAIPKTALSDTAYNPPPEKLKEFYEKNTKKIAGNYQWPRYESVHDSVRAWYRINQYRKRGKQYLGENIIVINKDYFDNEW